jgi:chromosome segregation ATPase
MSKKKQKQKQKGTRLNLETVPSIIPVSQSQLEPRLQDIPGYSSGLQQGYLEQSALIAALETQNLAAQKQLRQQVDTHLALQEQHANLQEKYAQQNGQIEMLHQKIATLEHSLAALKQLDTASSPQVASTDSTLIEQLTNQITFLKAELTQQRQANLTSEEKVQVLKQELETQTTAISSLQTQLSELRSAAQIGEAYLNRWRSRNFRG